MLHIIYKTTNTVNNNFYIGKHSTKNKNDSYLGSGLALKRAIKKYGKNYFVKEILFFAFTEEYAYEIEKEFLTDELIFSNSCYNMKGGGKGAGSGKSHFMFGKTHTDEAKEKISNAHNGENNHMFGKTHTDEAKEKISMSRKGQEMPSRQGENHHFYGKSSPFTGKIHTDEAKDKNSKSHEKYEYKIHTPNGVDTCFNLNKYCKENKLNQGAMSSNKKNKGYWVISKTERIGGD